MSNQVCNTFICSGCGETFPLIEMSRIGPNNYRWCSNQSCLTVSDLVYSQVRKALDKQGREGIAHFREIGDKEGEEIMMALYMIDKMEPVS